MKRISITLVFFLISLYSFSQGLPLGSPSGNNIYGLKAKTIFTIPVYSDTATATSHLPWDSLGTLIETKTGQFYYRDTSIGTHKWTQLASEVGVTFQQSIINGNLLTRDNTLNFQGHNFELDALGDYDIFAFSSDSHTNSHFSMDNGILGSVTSFDASTSHGASIYRYFYNGLGASNYNNSKLHNIFFDTTGVSIDIPNNLGSNPPLVYIGTSYNPSQTKLSFAVIDTTTNLLGRIPLTALSGNYVTVYNLEQDHIMGQKGFDSAATFRTVTNFPVGQTIDASGFKTNTISTSNNSTLMQIVASSTSIPQYYKLRARAPITTTNVANTFFGLNDTITITGSNPNYYTQRINSSLTNSGATNDTTGGLDISPILTGFTSYTGLHIGTSVNGQRWAINSETTTPNNFNGDITNPNMSTGSGTDSSLVIHNGVIKKIVAGSGAAASLQAVTTVGNVTTINTTFKNLLYNGDSTIKRTAFFEGGSLYLQRGTGYIVSATQTMPYLISQQFGYLPVNDGVGGRTMQQVTVADNSLYSNILNIHYYSESNGGLLYISAQINDAKGDTTKYLIGTFATQFTAYLDTAIARGWPVSHIIVYEPTYYNPSIPGTNQGNIPYRQHIYDSVEAAVTTALGVHFYDAYFPFKVLFTTNPNLLFSDSIHQTPSGAITEDSMIAVQLNSWSIVPNNYNTTKTNVYGTITSLGNITTYDSLNAQVTNSTDITSIGKTRLQGQVTLGGASIGNPASYHSNEFGGLWAYTFNDSLNSALTWSPISFYSTSTQNSVNIGSFTSPSAQNPGKAATDIDFYTNTSNTITGAALQIGKIFGEGNQVWAANGTYADNNHTHVLYQAKYNDSGSTNISMLLNDRITPLTDNQTNHGVDFRTLYNAGTGVNTATLAGGTGYATGTFTAVPLTGGTGTGAIATLVVSAGAVTTVTVTTSGNNYTAGDVLSAAASFDGVGSGSGFTYTITVLGKVGTNNSSAFFETYPIKFGSITTPTTFINGQFWYTSPHIFARLNGATVQMDIANTSGVVSVAAGGTGTGSAPATNNILVASSSTAYAPVAVSGDLTNSVGAFTIGANKVTYAKMQAVSTTSKLLGSSSTTTAVQEITLGTGLSLSGTTLSATGSGGTVTSFSAGTLSPLFTTSVATSTTTPALTFALTNAAANSIFGNNQTASATPGYQTSIAITGTGSFGYPTAPRTNVSIAALHSIYAHDTIFTNTIVDTGDFRSPNSGSIYMSTMNAYASGGYSGVVWNNGTGRFETRAAGTIAYAHTIFTPTTGGTVALVNNQYNIINPAGALLALTVNLPSSPANNDVVYLKFTQAVSTVSYANGTVSDGITNPIAGGLVVLTFDSGAGIWY